MAKLTLYSVMAYRFGHINQDAYQVGAFASKDYAIEAAKEEASYRDFKYGVAVYEWTHDSTKKPKPIGSRPEDGKLVHYESSKNKEKAPHLNTLLEFCSAFANTVTNTVKEGGSWSFNSTQGTTVFESIISDEEGGIPTWLIEKVIELEKIKSISSAYDKHYQVFSPNDSSKEALEHLEALRKEAVEKVIEDFKLSAINEREQKNKKEGSL